MFGNKNGSRTGSGVTLIATNCEMVGDVHFSDQLLVNGVVKGNIRAREGSKAVITVSEKGQVNGEIRVPNVIINGNVCGDIYSDNHIELAAKAVIEGDIYYKVIEMVRCSRVDGNLVHLQDGKKEIKAVEADNPEIQITEPENIKAATLAMATPGKAS